MHIQASYFDLDGQCLVGGEFSLLARSLDSSIQDASTISGFDVMLVAAHFAVLGIAGKRLVVGYTQEEAERGVACQSK